MVLGGGKAVWRCRHITKHGALKKLSARNGRWAGRAGAVISVAIQIKTGRLFKTVPPFFGCLPVVAAFAFLFAFRFVPEQIGAHQRFECVIVDFAFIELMCHRAFLLFCIKTGADCSLPVRMGQEGAGYLKIDVVKQRGYDAARFCIIALRYFQIALLRK